MQSHQIVVASETYLDCLPALVAEAGELRETRWAATAVGFSDRDAGRRHAVPFEDPSDDRSHAG